jgi:hypothetical protein
MDAGKGAKEILYLSQTNEQAFYLRAFDRAHTEVPATLREYFFVLIKIGLIRRRPPREDSWLRLVWNKGLHE